MKEKLIIQNILSGNTSAYKYFVETYQDMAFSIAYNICYNRLDAEDIVQEAFVNAYLHLATFNNKSKFSSWLYRIVFNISVSHTRSSSQKVIKVEFNNNDEIYYRQMASTDHSFESDERYIILHETLKKMNPDERLILTLYYIDEYKVKDIMQITGYSEANIKTRLCRARKKLSDKVFSIMEYKAS